MNYDLLVNIFESSSGGVYNEGSKLEGIKAYFEYVRTENGYHYEKDNPPSLFLQVIALIMTGDSKNTVGALDEIRADPDAFWSLNNRLGDDLKPEPGNQGKGPITIEHEFLSKSVSSLDGYGFIHLMRYALSDQFVRQTLTELLKETLSVVKIDAKLVP